MPNFSYSITQAVFCIWSKKNNILDFRAIQFKKFFWLNSPLLFSLLPSTEEYVQETDWACATTKVHTWFALKKRMLGLEDLDGVMVPEGDVNRLQLHKGSPNWMFWKPFSDFNSLWNQKVKERTRISSFKLTRKRCVRPWSSGCLYGSTKLLFH